jgi:hypothetical protein
METMKTGTHFTNSGMALTLLCHAEAEDTNLVLVVCSDDRLFITARNLRPWQGAYTWDWGHYFSDIHEAVADYDTRMRDLQSN